MCMVVARVYNLSINQSNCQLIKMSTFPGRWKYLQFKHKRSSNVCDGFIEDMYTNTMQVYSTFIVEQFANCIL